MIRFLVVIIDKMRLHMGNYPFWMRNRGSYAFWTRSFPIALGKALQFNLVAGSINYAHQVPHYLTSSTWNTFFIAFCRSARSIYFAFIVFLSYLLQTMVTLHFPIRLLNCCSRENYMMLEHENENNVLNHNDTRSEDWNIHSRGIVSRFTGQTLWKSAIKIL